jgi:hypothetical protein
MMMMMMMMMMMFCFCCCFLVDVVLMRHFMLDGVCVMRPGGCQRHCPVSANISTVTPESDPGHSTTLFQGVASSRHSCDHPTTGAPNWWVVFEQCRPPFLLVFAEPFFSFPF